MRFEDQMLNRHAEPLTRKEKITINKNVFEFLVRLLKQILIPQRQEGDKGYEYFCSNTLSRPLIISDNSNVIASLSSPLISKLARDL